MNSGSDTSSILGDLRQSAPIPDMWGGGSGTRWAPRIRDVTSGRRLDSGRFANEARDQMVVSTGIEFYRMGPQPDKDARTLSP